MRLADRVARNWGEQTEMSRKAADWYHAKMLSLDRANIGMTRTPLATSWQKGGTTARSYGSAPDFNMVAKYADEWVAVNTGQDGAVDGDESCAFLRNFIIRKTPYFIDCTKIHRRSVFGRAEERRERCCTTGPVLLRAGRLENYKDQEQGGGSS
ncbi:MAG: molybdopterin-dependent oxidoreductase [Planctomycetaceae bacterium]|nr:molybdopterin-dependent oxidoreductase [Planctomycetaceae bacterium]